MKRRNFLGLVAASSLFPYMGFAQDSKVDKACIFIYLHGGISHIDFTHGATNVPSEYRSVNGVADTGLGFSLGGNFTGHESDTGGQDGLAGDAGIFILRDDRIQDSV